MVVESLGDQIRVKRLELGFHRSQLAAVLGITIDDFRLLESDKLPASVEVIGRFNSFLASLEIAAVSKSHS